MEETPYVPTVTDALGTCKVLAEAIDGIIKQLEAIATDIYSDLATLQERIEALEEQASKGSRVGWH